MSTFKLLFSDYFNIKSTTLDNYGALNICLSADMPLFIDPFLLFASDNEHYNKLHHDLINHLLILKEIAIEYKETGIDHSIFRFPEIKQNWLGVSKMGNDGRGLGKDFAKKMIKSFNGFYNSFGNEEISAETHIEKLTLLNPGVGRDFISDFTTNLILEYLLEYTEKFALKYLAPNQVKEFNINCVFDEKFKRWMPKKFKLPYLYLEEKGDFIILSPLDILTKDESAINNSDFYSNFTSIATSIKNVDLRNSINEYFRSQLPKKPTKKERTNAINKTTFKFPELIDYYIKSKEDRKDFVIKLTRDKINKLTEELIDALGSLGEILLDKTEFYDILPNSYKEALDCAHFLKDVIENNDGYRIFYNNGIAISKEDTIQRIFRLTWFASPFDVNSEVNNGRGPADYKVSYGIKDSTIIEFKLGKSSSLKKNLANQTDVYKKASKSANDIKVILCYSEGEVKRVENILNLLKLVNQENIVIIKAYSRPSASKA